MVSQDIDLVEDTETDDRSEPEMEFEPEVEQILEQELTILGVLEWLQDVPSDPKETLLTNQFVDQPASNTSVTTALSQTGLLQMAPCAFPNPISICSIQPAFGGVIFRQ